MRRVELFFIKFFTFWVRCIKKRIDLLKKRYTKKSRQKILRCLFISFKYAANHILQGRQ
ncbi:hypothetical protein HMPREF9554_02524 [Treponema phagedenis F0421]|nr:hypothetical protein HMPREF9554_02524 [Treponema phagedenis F0421]